MDVEITVSDDVMLVLRSLSGFSLIPSLDAARIDPRFRDEVVRAAQKVVDSAFRESAVAFADCCRDAATVIASRWLWQETGDEGFLHKELAPLSEALSIERNKFVAANAARTIAILHSRGKSNEQVAKGVDRPSEDDTEFAIRVIALILRELGWAVSWS